MGGGRHLSPLPPPRKLVAYPLKFSHIMIICIILARRVWLYEPQSRRVWLYEPQSRRVWLYEPQSRRVWLYEPQSRRVWLYEPQSRRVWLYEPQSRRVWLYEPQSGELCTNTPPKFLPPPPLFQYTMMFVLPLENLASSKVYSCNDHKHHYCRGMDKFLYPCKVNGKKISYNLTLEM